MVEPLRFHQRAHRRRQFAMTDGSVQFISNAISLTLFRAWDARAVGEVAELP